MLYYSEDELWKIMIDMINALAYMQVNRSKHGDLRPCNIMITKDG